MTTCIIGWPPKVVRVVEILNPDGMHNIAVGLDCPVEVNVRGNAGYFVGGMNKQARITRVWQCGMERRREHHVGQRAHQG